MRQDILRLRLLLLALLLTPGLSIAESAYLPLEQTRQVSVEAFALWVTGDQRDAENAALGAEDFDSFDAEPAATATTANSRAAAHAGHSSQLLPRRIIAAGSMAIDALSECIGQGCSAGGKANSLFEFSFELGEPIPYRIEGSLAATNASSRVELTGSGGVVFEIALSEAEDIFEFDGTMEAGIYTLRARVNGDCDAEEIEGCASTGHFDAQLRFDTGIGATAHSFSTLKALYD